MDSVAPVTTECLAALALDLLAAAKKSPGGLVFVDATGDRLERLAAAAAGFDGDFPVLSFPAWDSLPYDRSPPLPGVVGTRVAALARLAEAPGKPCLVLTTARAAMGRVAPPQHWLNASLLLQPGATVDLASVAEQLRALGYTSDEHVEEAGHMAVRSHVIDIFPGDADVPHRMPIADGRITAIHRIDPVSQRSEGENETGLLIRPVHEPVPTDSQAALVSLLDYLPDAAVLLHEEVETRWVELREQAEDAFAATARVRRSAGDGTGPAYLPPPSQLLVSEAELKAWRGDARPAFALGQATATPPLHRTQEAVAAIRDALPRGRVVVAAGPGAGALHAALTGRHGTQARLAADWADATGGPEDVVAILPVALDSGFARNGLHLFAVLQEARRRKGHAQLILEEPPRFGDIVVHRGHGVCVLRGLARVGEEERVALEFADETELLVPTGELAQVWRYGSDVGAHALDRVDGEAWRRREGEIEKEVVATAAALAAEAAARAALVAPKIEPPLAAYARFTRRFTFALSPDQADAIEAVLADMRLGQPMDRLVCGDVGFGKTEVALRAAAAAALAGFQVAIVAPTTVLARQHFDTFTRRFAGLGITVAPLLRGAAAAEGKAVREGLADGSIGVVVGTQAIAAEAVRFKNLALVVIDEEQRFGDVQKRRLSTLRNPAGGVHTLVMTATPIPRTLQTAMVGLRQISVIATAPVRRKPPRTFALPWDPVVVREALLREHGRGGQSFVVCPRIEDIDGIAARLADLAPELSVVTVHGKLKPQAIEGVVSAFAGGEHDVLLATNIIEAGLDIPRANTILVTRPDRFGLAQLHQMRGRVGRGARRSYAYLLTEPGMALSAGTLQRLHTLEAQEHLGAGVAISLADMDARGAGDLFGERQAGHVHAIGTELYQFLLAAELTVARGEAPAAPFPSLHTELLACIPEEMVAEPNLRLELYRRLARLRSPAEAGEMAEELFDRFGELPEPVANLLDEARLRAWCAHHRVVQVQAGPQAVALTPENPRQAPALAKALPLPAEAKRGRVIVSLGVAEPAKRLRQLCEGLQRV